MKFAWKRYVTIIVVLILSCVCIASCVHTQVSVKYEKDYSVVDMLNAQKIILGIKEPSVYELKKYDMNGDGEISYTDIQIIQHLLVHIYDEYITVTINDRNYVFAINRNMEKTNYE